MLFVWGRIVERLHRVRVRALSPQLLYSRRCVCSLEDLLCTSRAVSLKSAPRHAWFVHTCESGSMAASEETLPSLALPCGASLDCPVGEVGLRTPVASLPLVPTDLSISINAEIKHETVKPYPRLCCCASHRRACPVGFPRERVGPSL